ncbi:MAG: hypothetical protein OJF61_002601 [Rhodanobacteraceae bacterium]|jgi:hypothetical protein|nr:MAG: hypothetical protein OJF61_002601 [Rhodanobacteraceae bacterium]
MNHSFVQAMRHRGQWVLGSSVALCLLIAFAARAVHADPADFQAMPGLWRIVLRVVDRGHAGPAQVRWRCLDEGGDPWAFFADPMTPAGARCQRRNAQRGSTSLTWTLSCRGIRPLQGTGRVAFDSAEHYTGRIELAGRGEVMRVEGARRAACTSPSD